MHIRKENIKVILIVFDPQPYPESNNCSLGNIEKGLKQNKIDHPCIKGYAEKVMNTYNESSLYVRIYSCE